MKDPEKYVPEKTTENDEETAKSEANDQAVEELAPPIRGGYFDRASAKMREVWHPRRDGGRR
jgi:hypothetical protein